MKRIACLIFILWISVQVSAQTLPFTEGEIDVNDPYVGQPIIYTLRIYTTENPSQDDDDESNLIIEPSFFGFGRSSVEIEPNSTVEVIDSTTYYVTTQYYVIYPLRSGELTIDPFRIEIIASTFNEASFISTNAINIDVQNHPEPAPDSFVNAVGQFDIVAQASPLIISSGDALTFSITISGTGNFEQMLAPIIELPENWRLFDGQTHYQQDSLRFGTKTFQWSVIVDGDGVRNIPAIEFSYFNPQTRAYESRTTAPISLNVSPATSQPNVTVERTQVVLTAVPVPDLMTISEARASAPNPPSWFWVLWLFPPLMILLIWVFARPKRNNRRQRTVKQPRKQSGNRALKQLRNDLLSAQSVEAKAAYQQISDTILLYLGTKTGKIVAVDDAREAMSKFPANYRDTLLACLDEATAGQYAPVTANDVRNLSQRVLRVCAAIEKAS